MGTLLSRGLLVLPQTPLENPLHRCPIDQLLYLVQKASRGMIKNQGIGEGKRGFDFAFPRASPIKLA
ncbi:MAG: hypothetical protein A2527_01125 [Candidatus Lambdaproteobacteria bacterium RIFOXYD2_FULL_50_16]|uniref:Uncharacterized protein n=1 Tax=Candidatus Lambdaproteobacteria bacterium RIFOXYD2_FULL_50_16 TaxID=1817772 RepID=A0A1F6GEJ0_9PROT|nr:MAG: hypothetical protein A2527_01125 [Candidatus Lambdaproteobacteria bacterium RIFOXYD2_FULL_50_16]